MHLERFGLAELARRIRREPARGSTAVLSACLLSVLVNGCGDGGDRQANIPTPRAEVSATGPRNACALLPPEEVQAVIGEPVRDSLALDMPGGGAPAELSHCNYATADNPSSVSLLLRRNLEGTTAEASSQRIRDGLTEMGATSQDVSGLGTPAFFVSDLSQLNVFTPDWYLIVTPQTAGGVDQARALAERALARLR